MGHVDIPDRVETRHLKAHIETEQIAKVEFEQETALVEKNTQAIVRFIFAQIFVQTNSMGTP